MEHWILSRKISKFQRFLRIAQEDMFFGSLKFVYFIVTLFWKFNVRISKYYLVEDFLENAASEFFWTLVASLAQNNFKFNLQNESNFLRDNLQYTATKLESSVWKILAVKIQEVKLPTSCRFFIGRLHIACWNLSTLLWIIDVAIYPNNWGYLSNKV